MFSQVKCFFVSALFILTACTPVLEPPRDSIVTIAEQTQAQQLADLLSLAQERYRSDRLMQPAEDSAYFWYKQALKLDETSPDAHAGMQQITARYLVLAKQAFDRGLYKRAEQMLDGAERVSAMPSEIAALRQQYKPVRSAAAANEFHLSVADLNVRNKRLLARLSDIARKAKDIQSRLLIIARNDSEGRWLYREMRAAVEGYRLRGNIALDNSPRIVLIDAPK